jgi:hypothetical protein
MLSPKEVIGRIRKIRFGIGLDEENLSGDQKAALDDKSTILDDAARLAGEINSKETYFIPELIQNADDNEYESVEATIKFIIRDDWLIIQNNEKGFDEENVDALCGVGSSTKKKTEAVGYIGEKGIGFKSVFKVTDEPHIYSNGFQFKFEYDNDEPSTTIIPHWVDNVPDFIDLAQTNILLPLKAEEKSEMLSEDIRRIRPSLLLFLRKLKVIEIEDEIKDKSIKIKKYNRNGKVEIEYGEGKDYWRLIKKTLEKPDRIEEERRKDVHKTEIILAFPLKEGETADTSNAQFVFAFLPVREYGFKFIIQADFLLTVSREDIIKDKKWNGWLRDSIAAVFLDAVEKFKADKNLKYTFYNYLNFKKVDDDFFSPVTEQIYKSLRDTECILTETDVWKKPSDVLRGNEEIKKLVPNEDLKNFFGKEYISSGIKAKESILRELDVEKFANEDLIECLENTDWVEKQSDDWFALLYEYLSKQDLPSNLLGQLKGLDIIRLENGELTSGREEDVFRSIDKKGKEYGFEKELRIAKRNIIDLITEREKQEKDLKILEFVKNLGIRSYEPHELIKNYILPTYESDEWARKDATTLVGHIKYIKENMRILLGRTDLWGRLKNSLHIRIDKTAEEEYEHIHSIYLSKIYGNENDLETLFDSINVNFVHPCYIDDILREYDEKMKSSEKSKKVRRKYRNKVKQKDLKKIEEDKNNKIKEWKEFFLKMGVNEGLRVVEIEKMDKTYLYDWNKKNLRKSNTLYVSKDYDPKQNFTNEHVEDYTLEFLDGFFRNFNSHKAFLLIKLLEKQWNSLSKYTKLKYKWQYHSWYLATADSSWIHILKNKDWLPTTQNKLAKPSEIFIDEPEIREVLGDSVSYLTAEIENEDFIKAIDINTEANVGGVLNHLKALVGQECGDDNEFGKLYNFLNNNYFGYDEYEINVAFGNHPLIYVPNTEKKFFTSHEVLWQDVSDIFGENRGYLEERYHDLRDFFVGKIGVSEKPSPNDYADVLVDLSQKDVIADEDEQIILKIYKELNCHLNPDIQEPISGEDWWDDFISKPIFFVNNKKFHNKENVFINDCQELYDLFKDETNIAFLWLPHDYHHDTIKFFIEAAKIRYLSEAVKTIPNFDKSSSSKFEKCTGQLRSFMPYIVQYLYSKMHEEYERLMEDSLNEKITNFGVYTIGNLEVRHEIQINNNIPIRTPGTPQRCLLYENKLYISEEFEEDVDYIAIELSKMFGEIKGLDDFITTIFTKRTKDKIKNLMDAKRIRELPDSEREFFEGFSQTKTEMDAAEPDEAPTVSEKTPRDPHEHESDKVFSEQNTEDPPKPPEGCGGSTDGMGKRWDPAITPTEARINVEKYKEPGYVPHPPKPPIGAPTREPSQIKREGSDISYDAVKIGKWGEEYALNCLKKEKREEYPDGEISDTQEGFVIEKDEEIIAEVKWLNKSNEQQKSYDIELIENNITYYIEVKSTGAGEKYWFDVSKGQWELMQEKGDKFLIYRVFGAGTKEAKLVLIENPAKRWRDGVIVAHPIRIQI